MEKFFWCINIYEIEGSCGIGTLDWNFFYYINIFRWYNRDQTKEYTNSRSKCSENFDCYQFNQILSVATMTSHVYVTVLEIE